VGIAGFPNLNQVTTFSHGTSPSGCKVLVEIVGKDEKEILMKRIANKSGSR
jgi:hypothetical protein